MNNFLFNPFKYIAGIKSLAAGIFILLATACISYFSHTHFPDLISVKIGADFPLTFFVMQSLSNWLVISIFLYIMAIIFSPTAIRLIDVFGTQAFARFPYFIASFIGFSDSIEKFGKFILWTTLKTGEETSIAPVEVGIAVLLMIFTLLLTIWLVTLMYNAFKVSTNLKGTKSAMLFIAAFILSMVATVFLNKFLIQFF